MEGKEMEHEEDSYLWKDEWTPPLNLNVEGNATFSLSPWQKTCVGFLHRCWREYGFALVGDEMGVGKVLSPSNETNSDTSAIILLVLGNLRIRTFKVEGTFGCASYRAFIRKASCAHNHAVTSPHFYSEHSE
jgi:hypothetical protein